MPVVEPFERWNCHASADGIHHARPGEGSCWVCGREFRDDDPEPVEVER